jgi:1,4-dihydroxy-6-naphthoate synthase
MTDRSAQTTLSAAISPCPNDTFVFGAWVLGMVGDVEGFRTRFVWEDIQALNEMAASGMKDLVKVSAVQAMKLGPEWSILDCGGAFGLGSGPKLVVPRGSDRQPLTIAVPGMMTTAFALLKACVNFRFEPVPMLFDRIPAAVAARQVDAGLLIHETALIHKELGLDLFMDLGAWWDERSAGLPLPLGLIVIRKSLGSRTKKQVEDIIRRSISSAPGNRSGLMPFIRHLARELDEKVIDEHIRTYVNDLSVNTGEKGEESLLFLKKISESGSPAES